MENQKPTDQTNTEIETPPTFDELAESSSGFVTAKNYARGAKVSFRISEFDKMDKSQKFGTWQAIYIVDKDGEQKRYGMPGQIAKALKDNYGIADYKDAIGKTLTLLVVKASSGSHTFEVVDCK